MMKWYMIGGACALVLCVQAHSQAIQLKGGTVLVGEIQDATSEGLSFKRLDNGGLLELRWEDLSPNAASKIKRLKGLVIENEEEVMVMADVVIYNSGAGRTEAVGVITDRTDDILEIKTRSGVLPIRSSALRDVRKREVPVNQIYTQSAYYQKLLADQAPGDDADKHIAIGEILRRAHDFENALVHLNKADALGGGKQKTLLPDMISRCELLKESEAEREHLKRIRIMRNRKDFTQAQQLVEEFEATYPDTKLGGDLQREKSRMARDQKIWLMDKITNFWDTQTRRVAEDKVRDKNVNLASARSYAESKMAEDLFERIGKLLDVDGERIQRLWEARDTKKRRAANYHYGIGSWVLGEDAILKDTKQGASESGDTESAKGGGNNRDLERLIRKMREVQKTARRIASKRKGGKAETEETWWADQSRDQKVSWLRAYFAEFGGAMNVVRAFTHPCGNCNGRGMLRSLGLSGQEQKSKCPVCHATRYTRAMRAN